MRLLLSYQEAMRVCARVVVVVVVVEAVVAVITQSASLVGVININDVSPRRVASTSLLLLRIDNTTSSQHLHTLLRTTMARQNKPYSVHTTSYSVSLR